MVKKTNTKNFCLVVGKVKHPTRKPNRGLFLFLNKGIEQKLLAENFLRTLLSNFINLSYVLRFCFRTTNCNVRQTTKKKKKSSNKLRMKALVGWKTFYQHSKLINFDSFLNKDKDWYVSRWMSSFEPQDLKGSPMNPFEPQKLKGTLKNSFEPIELKRTWYCSKEALVGG